MLRSPVTLPRAVGLPPHVLSCAAESRAPRDSLSTARAARPGKPIPETLRARCDSAAPARCASQTMREARSPSHANATARAAGASRMSRKSCARCAGSCLRIERCACSQARYESGFSRRPRRSHRQHRAQAGSAWSGRAMPKTPDSQSPIVPCHRHIGQTPSPMTVFVTAGSLLRSFAPPMVRIAVPPRGCWLCRSKAPYCRLPRCGSFHALNVQGNRILLVERCGARLAPPGIGAYRGEASKSLTRMARRKRSSHGGYRVNYLIPSVIAGIGHSTILCSL
jgi:hypothetical protein